MGQRMESSAARKLGRGGRGRVPLRVGALAACVVLAAFLASASAAFALAASPAWQIASVHAPTNFALAPPTDEVESVTVNLEESSGSNEKVFQLGFDGEPTGVLPYDATPGEVQSALEALGSVGHGNVTVTGGPGNEGGTSPYVVSWGGALAGQTLTYEHNGEQQPSLEVFSVEVNPARESGQGQSGGVYEEREEENEIEPGVFEVEYYYEGVGSVEIAVTTTGAPGPTVDYQILPTNVGALATSGTVTVTDTLPPGVTTKVTSGRGWACTPAGSGQRAVTCTSSEVVDPDSETEPILVEASLSASSVTEGQQLVNRVTIVGGGAAEASTEEIATVSSTPASFGVQSFTAQTFGGDSAEPFTQAAGRPYAASTSFVFNTVEDNGAPVIAGNVKDVDVKLPAGFIGNPQAVPRCTQAEFVSGLTGGPVENGSCGPESQVGTVSLFVSAFGEAPEKSAHSAVYNLVPPPGVAAELGFVVLNVPVRIDARVVREDGAYQVELVTPNINEGLTIFGVSLTFWGVPAESSHTPQRYVNEATQGAVDNGSLTPFLTNPSDCAQEQSALPATSISVDSWEDPGAFGAPVSAVSPAVTGCGLLSFDPSISFAPESTQADQPAGYRFGLEVPQHEGVIEDGTPDLQDATVSLPEGVSVSPSAAEGLVACSDQQIGVESVEAGSCPSASKIGAVRVKTPLLAEELTGSVFIGEPECGAGGVCTNADAEDGKIFRLFIEAEGSGVVIKLPGTVSANASTGRLTATFDNNPQLPFEELSLSFNGGARAPLSNPQSCGTFTTTSQLTAWSAPETPVASPSAQFATTGCASVFSPSFSAGTTSSAAGSFSPFTLSFGRSDGEEDLSGVSVQLPPGLLGKLAGIPRCGEAQANAGTCGAESLIGTTTVDAGAGSSPLALTGQVYLTGPYGGDPFGLSIVVPAVAGPFNLGDVVVRASIAVNPHTAALTVTSGALPQIVDGVQTRLQKVSVDIDRDGFTLNPTSCAAKSLRATLTSVQGVSAAVSSPFTATGCGSLAFKPVLTASTSGKTSKKAGASLAVKIAYPSEGQANVAKVHVQLPKKLPSRQSTLEHTCPEAMFDANPASCPPLSVVGMAKAITPLLNVPLEGPAYYVSHGGAKFPEIIAVLQGEGVTIDLAGETFISKKGITTSTFASVPDAPVSSFELKLPQGSDSVLAAPGNKLCKDSLVMPTTITAQDGAQITQNTKIQTTGCAKTKKAKVTILKAKLKGGKLVVSVKTTSTGTLRISGTDIKTKTSKKLKAGTHKLNIKLSSAGETAKQQHKKIKLKARLTAGKQTAAKTTSVKL